MEKVNVGVVGLGAIGKRLMSGMKQLYAEQIEIIAVCDVDENLSMSAAKEFSVERYYTNHVDMLKLPELDFVYIAVPPKYHLQVALDAINAGKNILCEKPLANSLEEARSMLDAVSETSLIHMMNFPLNYAGAMHKMMSLIADGVIGKIDKIDLNLHFPQWPRVWQQNSWVGKREQGGYILEVGAHWIQFIQKNFGQIAHIEGEVTYPEDQTLCEESFWANFVLDNNLNVHLDGKSQFEGKEKVELIVHGTNGSLMIEDWGTLKGKNSNNIYVDIPTNDIDVKPIFHHMIAAIQGLSADIYDFTVGYNVQVVLEALKNPNLVNGIDLMHQYK